MNPIRLIKTAIAAVKDPDRDFDERIYLILSFVSEIMVFGALIGDIAIKDNPYEIIVIIATLIFIPIISLICVHFDRIKTAIRITVIGVVFFILPGLFFFGGGVKGGGVIWIVFAFMYVGLVLNGKWRNVMFTLITVLTLGCYIINYYYPWWVYRHSQRKFFVDNFISLVLVGILCFIMNWSQARLFKDENERAEQEAKRAEELARAQNRFFSSMSHEIRTPINSILGLNELILRDQGASDEVVKDASGIQGAGKMLLALINDILDLSKIESGSMDIVPVDYHTGEMLTEVVNMLSLRAHDKDLGFEVSVDPDVPRVLHGDEVRIKQIIINLLNNAVKYTSKGHVGLRVESRDTEEGLAEIIISISDTGMGIKKEDIPYLFNAFKRVDEGKNRHIEGTGLGLSIVKQLVELMDGTISVNSIYGEGSTFTVTIMQRVSDHTGVGELNIQNQQVIKRSSYESSFLAPEVRILIVDDNEMNLEVEKRLLADTDMGIDTALSGKEALEMSLKTRYDAIFMDHLMPGIDGIECLSMLREQTGSLNRTTPVIVLTANAGSENRELYIKAGFDGYLVKPVSGEAMEETLIRHVPREKIILRSVMMGESEEIHTSSRYAEKAAVLITSSSMCDLPDSVIKKYGIPIIPFMIKTDEGTFKDGVNMDAYELVRHIGAGKEATSFPPDENAYTEFFSENLKKAHHIIHISMTTSMSRDFKIATEAAKSFDNVTVINSECLSSAMGILVLIGVKLVQQGIQPEDIVSELETVKRRLRCSFVIDTTDYMAKNGLVRPALHRITEALSIHPSLRIREDKAGVGGLWLGRTRRAYRKYIKHSLPPDVIPDSDIVFVTYVDIPTETLKWIEEEIKKTAFFKHVVFQQASAAISTNCGSGTFGVLYFLKSNKSYNIASLIDSAQKDEEIREEEVNEELPEEPKEEAGLVFDRDDYEVPETYLAPEDEPSEKKEYLNLEGIDTATAIKNSGSEEAFKTVLKIFHDSIPDRSEELENSLSSGDYQNYTVKIHALKSSSRLVGAMELGKMAEDLEMAGKEGNEEFIKANHPLAMKEYLKFKEILSPLFTEEEPGEEEEPDKPLADKYLMESIYEDILDASEKEDQGRIMAILDEIGEFSLTAPDKEKLDIVREKIGIPDFDGIKEIIG